MADTALNKLLELVKPEYNFSSNEVPKAPDYNLKDNWLALPDTKGYELLVPSIDYSPSTNSDIDVFYIHPTGFFEKKWNFNLNKSSSAYERSEVMLANQASVFNASCNIYAPEYRQATYYSFFSQNKDGTDALDIAYSDVEAAFDFYIDNFNNGKPFFIYGHSQGALHGQRLIHNKIINSNLVDQFINAYLIGYIIPEKSFSELFHNLSISKSKSDIRSVISWSTVVEGFKRTREKTPHWTPNGWSFQNMSQKIVGLNPFNWTSSSEWVNQNNSHCSIINKSNTDVFTDLTINEHTNSKKKIGLTKFQNFNSRINKESGLLETKGELIDKMRKMRSFTGDLHSFDVMLFWGSLRENINTRIKEFKK